MTTIEISNDEYKRYQQDMLHDLRISYGSRCRVYSHKGKCYCEIRPHYAKCEEIIYETIQMKLNNLQKWIMKNKDIIEDIYVCKSVKSGYVDEGLAEELLYELHERIDCFK